MECGESPVRIGGQYVGSIDCLSSNVVAPWIAEHCFDVRCGWHCIEAAVLVHVEAFFLLF